MQSQFEPAACCFRFVHPDALGEFDYVQYFELVEVQPPDDQLIVGVGTDEVAHGHLAEQLGLLLRQCLEEPVLAYIDCCLEISVGALMVDNVTHQTVLFDAGFVIAGKGVLEVEVSKEVAGHRLV